LATAWYWLLSALWPCPTNSLLRLLLPLLLLLLLHQPWLLLCELVLRRQLRPLLFRQTSKPLQPSFLMPASRLPVSRVLLLLPHPLTAGSPGRSSSHCCWRRRFRRSHHPISHATSQSHTGVRLMQAAG
jgi:hypothetical protein